MFIGLLAKQNTVVNDIENSR